MEFLGQILLIGGKNEKSLLHGSKSIWQFDPENETWARPKLWPEMEFEHFYHGCAKAVVDKVPGWFICTVRPTNRRVSELFGFANRRAENWTIKC